MNVEKKRKCKQHRDCQLLEPMKIVKNKYHPYSGEFNLTEFTDKSILKSIEVSYYDGVIHIEQSFHRNFDIEYFLKIVEEHKEYLTKQNNLV
jgi:hypothetical protein